MAGQRSLGSAGLWAKLHHGLLSVERSGKGLWSALTTRLDRAQWRPRQAEGIVVRELRDRQGTYFVLKNPERRTYLRLSPRERFLWSQMNGQRSLHEIVAAYFLEYGAFAYSLCLNLVAQLGAKGMLQPKPQRILTAIDAAVETRQVGQRLTWPARALLRQQLVLSGLDVWVTWLHRRGGRLLFSRPAQLLFVVVSVIGLVVFWRVLQGGSYGVLGADAGQGLAAMWLIVLGPVVIHELGHALTTKHYGREVNRGGFLLFFGMPAAFVETTDIWLEGKGPRLAVTWAGPYTGLILGGAAALGIWAAPEGPLAGLLFRTALIAYLMVFLNLNPLLKLDGYYLLSDWLEIPLLRERSLSFVQRRLVPKLRRLERFKGEELIYAAFGLLALAWTVYAIYLSAFFWNRRIHQGLQALMSGRSGLLYAAFNVFLLLVAASFVLLLVLQLAAVLRRLAVRLGRAGRMAHAGRASLSLVGVSLVVAAGLVAFLPSRVTPLVETAALGLSAWWLGLAARQQVGSRRWWWLGGASASAFLLAAIGLGPLQEGIPGTVGLAFGLALLTVAWDGRGGLRWLPLGAAGLGLSLLGWGWLSGQPVWRLWGSLSVLSGAGLYLMAGQAWEPAAEATGPGHGGGGAAVLRHVFRHLVRWILAGARVTAGLPGRDRVAQAFNGRSGVMGWGVRVDGGVLGGDAPADLGLLELADVYGDCLEELLRQASREIGRPPVRGALVMGYDRLWWEEREVAEEYLLSRLPWAGELRQRFRRQRDEVLELLRRMPLFVEMSLDELRALSARLRRRRFAAGEAIIRQGDPGDAFHVVSRGRVDVFQADDAGLIQKVNEHGRGGYFGELALLSDAPRNATCRAATAVEVLSLARSDFDALVRRRLELGPKVDRALDQARLLRRMPLFEELDGRALQELASRLERVELSAGDYLFRQGEAGDRFYLIEQGEVEILLEEEGRQRAIERRGPGEYFGEVALLLDVPRTASVRAALDSVLLALDRETFRSLVEDSLLAGRTLELAGTRRLRDVRGRGREPATA